MERFYQFFSDNFMAPHGFCFRWLPEIVWLHVFADGLIAASYLSIPVALWAFARKRPDVPFNNIFFLFATFITLCGLTHIVDIVVLWKPYYGPQGLLLLATGIVSATTAIVVWKILPSALTLPSPSELFHMNRKLAESYDEVERKVHERTAQLEAANLELIEARKKADEASRAKTEFLANMSHEIRTPMNVVIGLTNILSSSDPLTTDQSKYLNTLKTSTDSLLSLIDDLLDIARIESSQYKLEEMPFNLYRHVQETVSTMEGRAAEKGLTFHLNVMDDLLKRRIYLGDPNRFRQVLLNLCTNAIKFTEKGGVIISFSREEGPWPEVDTIKLSVADTGIGIESDKQDKIFEKFVQGDATVNRKYGGTGLGLSISKALIESMGGEITLFSKPGEGAVFTITLPLKIAQNTVIEPSSHTENAAEKGSFGTGRKVLLAEDYEPNVLVASHFLQQFGFECDVAENGLQAIEKRFSDDYAMILMDVQMPACNGLEATQEIRRLEEERNVKPIPIIGMTAHAYATDYERCLQAGMDDYLAKPYKAEDLRRKMSAQLTKQA